MSSFKFRILEKREKLSVSSPIKRHEYFRQTGMQEYSLANNVANSADVKEEEEARGARIPI
jgi:hypothetical protein